MSIYKIKKVVYIPSHKFNEYDDVWVGIKFDINPPQNFVLGIRWTQYSRNICRNWNYYRDNEIGDNDDKKYKETLQNPEDIKSMLYFKVGAYGASLDKQQREIHVHASAGDRRTIEFAIYCKDICTGKILWLTEYNKNNVITISDDTEHVVDVQHNYY